MKEIKFRYIYKFKREVSFAKQFIVIEKAEYLKGLENIYGENYELIAVTQYIGLKKNGVEIFEGDILAHPVKELLGSDYFYVKYENCCFIAKYQDNLSSSSILAQISKDGGDAYVVGNIYQNKELLGDRND